MTGDSIPLVHSDRRAPRWQRLTTRLVGYGLLLLGTVLYLGPFVVGNTAVGWIVGSIVADVAFYVMAIFSYERFTELLAGPARPQPTSVPA